MKAIAGNKKKNDPLDAETIGNLLRTNYFPEAYPYPREMRTARDLLRRRHWLVRIRAGAYAHIPLVFQHYGFRDVNPADVKHSESRSVLLERFSDEAIRWNLELDFRVIELLTPLIAEVEAQILEKARQHNPRDYLILQTTPGIGPMIALNILYETHHIGRFRKVQNYSSYCRVVKCERESCGRQKGAGNQKIGNPYLKWAYSQIIIHAQKSNEMIKKYYQRLESKYGRKRARAQITHKFCVAAYFMLKRRKAFDVARFVGQSAR
jgi:transposase